MKKTLQKLRLTLVFTLLITSQVLFSQSIIFIDVNASGSNNGTSWSDAYNDLQEGLNNSSPGDSVWVAAGTYYPTTTTDRDTTFKMPDSVAVYGGFDGSEFALNERDWKINETVLSGDIGTADDSTDNSFHVVEGGNYTVLNGFIIEEGNADDASDPNRFGGGMYNSSGLTNVVVKNCTFRYNFAEQGGGMAFKDISNAIVDNCRFISNNTSSDGGGLKLFDSEVDVTNCVFAYNTTVTYGAGLMYWGAGSGNPNVTNCTFYSNDAGTGSNSGGAIHGRASGISINISNCIFSNNLPGAIALTNGATAQVNYSAIVQTGYYGGTNTSEAPLLDDYGFAEFKLNPASPCIDAGDPNSPNDPDGSRADMGANHQINYEQLDAGVTVFASPQSGALNNHPPVKAVITNWGNDNLTSAYADWDINGLDQSGISWSGNLATGEKDTIILDQDLDFSPGYNIFTAWTENPNSATDDYTKNDTLSQTILLEGFRTIGPDTCDFETINEAISYIENSSPFAINYHFYIVEGTYNEQITIPEISGQTEQDQLFFSSYNKDSSSVIITSDSADYTIKLNGADYFNFDYLTITNDSTGKPVELTDNTEYNSFNYCSVKTDALTNLVSFSSSLSNTGIQFENCYFGGGYRGILGDYADYLIIRNCSFANQTKRSIELDNLSDFTISGNKFINTTGNDGKAMYLVDVNNGLISNNMINVTGGSESNSAFYVYNGDGMNIYHNTLHTDIGPVFRAYNFTGSKLKNNIFSTSGEQPLVNFGDDPTNESDYNVFSTNAVKFGYWGGSTLIYSFEEWQDSTALDSNSYAISPAFIGENDLHASSFPMDNKGTPLDTVKTDIDGEARSETTPDIGADEYTSPYSSFLTGTYTIGATKADYSSFADAIDALYARGTNGEITFDIQPGTYTERITLYDQIYRSQPNSLITFQSESQDSSDTWLKWEENPSEDEAIHIINGLDYVRINKLGFDLTPITVDDWTLFESKRKVDSLVFTDNLIKGSSSSSFSLINASPDINDTENWYIARNYSDADAGISLYSTNNNLIFENNYFKNFTEPLRIYFHNDLKINDNSIGKLYLIRGNNTEILRNQFINPEEIIHEAIEIYNYPEDSSCLIANNFISLYSSNYNYNGLKIRGGRQYEVYHNTLLGLGLEISEADSIQLKNNLIFNSLKGTALNLGVEVSGFHSDYNNFYSSDTTVVSDTITNYKTLDEWQNKTGLDMHSISFPSIFKGDSTFHIESPDCNNTGIALAKITQDIEGDARDENNPDIGADEYKGCSNPISAGMHTVGPNGDYKELVDVIDSLNRCGISGSVEFSLETGQYQGQNELKRIYSTEDSPWIVFKSAIGQADSVVWKHQGTSEKPYHLKVDNARNISFNNITFNALDSVNTGIINLTGTSENLYFSNCQFKAPSAAQNNSGLVFGAVKDSVFFLKNRFENGKSGINLTPFKDSTKNVIIDSNQFIKQSSNSIKLEKSYAPYITKNTFVEGPADAIELTSCSGSSSYPAVIANNMIDGGVSISKTAHLSFIYNSLKKGISVSNYNGGPYPDVNVVNNVISTEEATKILDLALYDPGNFVSDYNLFFTNGSVFGDINGTDYPDFSAWKTGTSLDPNSLFMEVNFISETDMHMQSIPADNQGTPIPEITEDIDGETRDGSTPDIGADEYDGIFTLGNDIQTCAGETIQLDAGEGFDSYEWSNDETTRKITVYSEQPDTFNYSVSVTYEGNQYTDDIQVAFQGPDAIAEDMEGCFGDTLVLTGNGGTEYEWYRDSLVSGQSYEVILNWEDFSKSFTLTVWDEMGCSDDTTIEVHSYSLPEKPVIQEKSEGLLATSTGFDQYMWYLDGTLQTEFATAEIEPTEEGNYQVIVSNGYCESAISDEYYFESTQSGINTYFEGKAIRIYPNPVDENLILQINNRFASLNIEITDVTGKVIYSDELKNVTSSFRYVVPFSDFSKGIYFLRMSNNADRITRRIIKR